MISSFLLSFLLSIPSSANYKPFYEEAFWHQELEAISGSDEIIAIANSVLHNNAKREPRRLTRIVLLYSQNDEWLYKKYLYNHRAQKFEMLYESKLSLVSSSYVDSNLPNFVKLLGELKEVDNDPLGNGYIEYYYQSGIAKFTKSYFSCGGRGDINGFAKGNYELLFNFYSIVNNSDAF